MTFTSSVACDITSLGNDCEKTKTLYETSGFYWLACAGYSVPPESDAME